MLRSVYNIDEQRLIALTDFDTLSILSFILKKNMLILTIPIYSMKFR